MKWHKHHWKIVGSGHLFIWFDCRKCGRELNVTRESLWGFR